MATDNTIFLPALTISEAAVQTNGSPPTDNLVKVVAGSDGTDIRVLLTDATGKLIVNSTLDPAAATAANQVTGNNSLASIDSKLTAPLAISAASLPLPAGASTSAAQTTGNNSLASIDSKLTSPLTVSVNNFPATQPISAVSLPLPTGAATETTLSAIATSVAGTLLVDGSAHTQPISASALPLPTGASTSALQTTANTSLASIDSKLTSPIAISAASLPLPTGAATEATLAAVNTKLVQLALGSQTQAASLAVSIASNQPAISTTTNTTPLVTQNFGSIAFGSLTNAFTTVMTTSADTRIIAIFSSLDTPVTVSLDGGTTSIANLDGESVVLDLGTSGMKLASGAVIQAKYSGSAPTTGSIRVSVIG